MGEQLSRREALEKYGYDLSTVVGVSMKPLLRSRKDLVYIEAGSDLKSGDVGLFIVSGEKYVLHRLIKIENGIYVFRGDNCITCEQVKKDDVLGKMTKFWRGKKEIVCDKSVSYKLYSLVWKYTYFLRYAFKRAYAACKAGLKRILRRSDPTANN